MSNANTYDARVQAIRTYFISRDTLILPGFLLFEQICLKGGSILSSFQDIFEGEEESSTKKEESNHDDHADETRTDPGTCHRR